MYNRITYQKQLGQRLCISTNKKIVIMAIYKTTTNMKKSRYRSTNEKEEIISSEYFSKYCRFKGITQSVLRREFQLKFKVAMSGIQL